MDTDLINLVSKQSHLYKDKQDGELPYSNFQNKLDLFRIIEEVEGGGDLAWQDLLDSEIVKYSEGFQDEITKMSQEIRSKLAEDLEKHKRFYKP